MVTPFAHGAVLRAPAQPADLKTLCGDGGVLVLAPHPDDESLAMGAGIAMAVKAGHPVAVVALTMGDRSHHSLRVPAPKLAALRRRELREALRHLGVRRPVLHLGHHDQRAPTTPTASELTALRHIARDIGATRIWTCWRGDPHEDHQRGAVFAEIVAQDLGLARAIEVPVWGRFVETSTDRTIRSLIAPPEILALKRRAIGAYRSQMTHLIPDDPKGFVMTARTRIHFETAPEIYLV